MAAGPIPSVLELDVYDEAPEIEEAIAEEIEVLRARLANSGRER
jgi:hypothetical protein